MDQRIDIAEEVINTVNSCNQVKKAFLRGSLTDVMRKDKYSDIDIGIDVSGNDNGAFAKSLPKLMDQHFDILFYDWSPSLLPSDFVITFFINNSSIFWFIDIQVFATPHHETLKKVKTNKYHHLLKLWILNLKYYIRGSKTSEKDIKKLARRALGEKIESQDLYFLMVAVLNEIKINIEPKLQNFVVQCEEELHHSRLQG
ncbi:hypothetical protein E3U55_10495 [Filobacillus milosensis]|uniref:Nucleotidyltransferase domain-containing protein n=1 Tax=Filobacillus milosensis TaxID=94137 RepID=A0A4Y8IGC7_9BACI|nr:hypothetical protein [Filobacillus milosensis]TFB19581.1 hypothetical protein E3U55_10495 [Filobacillus milosensis]